MSRSDDRDDTLPVTAEVGGEGGSFADAALQADTFRGERGNDRVDRQAVGAAAGEAAAAAVDGEPARPADDEVRHATEPPVRPKERP